MTLDPCNEGIELKLDVLGNGDPQSPAWPNSTNPLLQVLAEDYSGAYRPKAVFHFLALRHTCNACLIWLT
jgi:hypothetical protein